MTTTKTNVEAVARAMLLEHLITKYPTVHISYHQETADQDWHTWKPEALAAIKAHNECLMEPSEEMVSAAIAVVPDYETHGEWLTRIFQAMLSAQEPTS